MKTTAVDKIIVDVCKVNNLWDRRFSAHSLRHGGASCLASMGIPMHIIQLMGRWKSDSFKVYTRVNLVRTLEIASRMMMQVPETLSSGMHDGLNFLKH
jgi:integrase